MVTFQLNHRDPAIVVYHNPDVKMYSFHSPNLLRWTGDDCRPVVEGLHKTSVLEKALRHDMKIWKCMKMVVGSKTLPTCTVWRMSMDAHEFEHHSFYLCHPLQETQVSTIKVFSSLRALREWLFFTCRWSLFASWWSLVQSQKVFLDECDLETLGFIPRLNLSSAGRTVTVSHPNSITSFERQVYTNYQLFAIQPKI